MTAEEAFSALSAIAAAHAAALNLPASGVSCSVSLWSHGATRSAHLSLTGSPYTRGTGTGHTFEEAVAGADKDFAAATVALVAELRDRAEFEEWKRLHAAEPVAA